MIKYINFYSISFSVQILLNIVFGIIVFKYYLTASIPIILLDSIPFELSQFISLVLVEILLIIFLVVTIIALIVVLKQSKDESISKSLKLSTIILPVFFVFVLQLFIFIPVATTKSKNNFDNQISINALLDKNGNENFEVNTYNICEKNILGKIAYFEKQANFSTNENANMNFLCSYQESSYHFINKKFERLEETQYALANKESFEDCTLYYDQNNNHISYSMIIKKNNVYFVSTYNSLKNDFSNAYSKEDFKNDSMFIYYEWNRF